MIFIVFYNFEHMLRYYYSVYHQEFISEPFTMEEFEYELEH